MKKFEDMNYEELRKTAFKLLKVAFEKIKEEGRREIRTEYEYKLSEMQTQCEIKSIQLEMKIEKLEKKLAKLQDVSSDNPATDNVSTYDPLFNSDCEQ